MMNEVYHIGSEPHISNLNIDPQLLERQRDWYCACADEENEFYIRIRDGLPIESKHDGASVSLVVKVLRFVVRMIQPSRLLEIGFNTGISSRIFLELGVQEVTSIEIQDNAEIRHGEKCLKDNYGDRFRLFRGHTILTALPELQDKKFDMAFIDGSHEASHVLIDISTCRLMGIKWMLCDDFWPHFGTVQDAIVKSGIYPAAIFGNMALCYAQ